ncbi:MAG: hypothetical protein CTY24_08375 [Methylobacter sp.]|nr:MAG: hypothetical protein CTY24_08375 [Methylobacter sp.]
MIFRIAFLLFLSSLPLFLTTEALMFWQMTTLAEITSQLASFMLLLALVLVVSAGFFMMSKSAAVSLRTFFSKPKRWARRLLFLRNRAELLTQKKYFQRRQIQYFADMKRRHLLEQDNKKQCQVLAKIIRRDLFLQKYRLTQSDFKQLQAMNKSYCKQRNVSALIALQQKLANEHYAADK